MTSGDPALTAVECAVLDLERSWWTHGETAGDKETQVGERLGLTPTRYYLVLSRLVDRPAALAHDPLLVRRLRRARAARVVRRAGAGREHGGGA